jgi:hypothetical protein
MPPTLKRLAGFAASLAVLQACAQADGPAADTASDAEPAVAAEAQTLAARLVGGWSGENETRGPMSFSFAEDHTAVWIVYPPTGADTLHLSYRVEEVDGLLELDLFGFEDGPLAGLEMYGLAAFDGTDSFRVDFEPGPSGDASPRPKDLSSTDVLTVVRVQDD